jgi:nicotinamide-nucleotide amidase
VFEDFGPDEMRAEIGSLAVELLATAKAFNIGLVTAESCTAGLLGLTISDAPGAADYFHGSFVTYTKEQKVTALGLPAELLRSSAVECEVAIAMANGALKRSHASLSAAITGVTGPEPDEDGNPVGRVCIAISTGKSTRAFERRYGDQGRELIRLYAVGEALRVMIELARSAGCRS